MHIHGQLYAPAREQALPQFELQVKQAARQRTSERPHSALHTCSAVSVLSALTSHPSYGEFVRRVCVHLLPATKVALVLSYYFKPQKTRTAKIFFVRSQGKKGKLSTGIQEFSKYDLAPLLLDLIF